MAFNLLPPDELARRMRAARLLRNVSQVDLNQMFKNDGLGQEEAGRLERGDLPLTRVRLDALIRNLNVPEQWFVSGSVDEIVHHGEPVSGAQLDEISQRLGQLEEGLAQVSHGMELLAEAVASAVLLRESQARQPGQDRRSGGDRRRQG